MITTFDNFKFRCSSLGRIVTKSGTLTDDAKTYLTEVFIGELYGVQKEIYGSALAKGIACEPDGLKMLSDILGKYAPNVKKAEGGGRENEYIKGTCDTYIDACIYDVKNAWDRFTFGKAGGEKQMYLYRWQVKGYMWLYERQQGRIFYCLNNMPEHMILDEENKMFFTQKKWTSKEDTDYLKACEELRKAHTYDDMPIHHRFKIWDVELTDRDIEKIKGCVEQAREYLNALLVEHKQMLVDNLTLMQSSVVEG